MLIYVQSDNQAHGRRYWDLINCVNRTHQHIDILRRKRVTREEIGKWARQVDPGVNKYESYFMGVNCVSLS